MNWNVFYNIYEKGLYSDIELTINEKLYKLHKFFISKSNFFKTLIDNIGKMSTNEEIKIEDVTGDAIPQKYIDDVLKWMYSDDELIVENLIDKENSFGEVLQYYYVIDFLQIGDSKEKIIKILDDKLTQQKPMQTFVEIRKSSEKKNTFFCGYSGNLSLDFDDRKILEYIYDNLIKTSRFFDLIKNKNLGRDLYSSHIYDTYMKFLYERKKERFTSLLCMTNIEKIDVINCMFVIHQFIIKECLPHLYYIPKSDSKLSLQQVKMLLDVVDIKNRAELIKLLEVDNWHSNGTLLWENIQEISELCAKYDMTEEYKNKLKALVFFYL